MCQHISSMWRATATWPSSFPASFLSSCRCRPSSCRAGRRFGRPRPLGVIRNRRTPSLVQGMQSRGMDGGGQRTQDDKSCLAPHAAGAQAFAGRGKTELAGQAASARARAGARRRHRCARPRPRRRARVNSTLPSGAQKLTRYNKMRRRHAGQCQSHHKRGKGRGRSAGGASTTCTIACAWHPACLPRKPSAYAKRS